MITPPGDYAWFANTGLAEAYSFIFVRGLTPEQLVARMGGRAEDLQYNSWLGANDEFTVPLSAGTRLVSLYRLDIKGLEEFRWVEDGEVRFAFWAQEGYSEEVPDELVETMKQIDHDYKEVKYELYQGPGLVLIERLTGIKLTPQVLEGSTYLSGVISKPPTTA